MYVIETDKIVDYLQLECQIFYFYDNNGNILLEFTARNDLDNATQNQFDGKSILSVISEIGLVSKNVRLYFLHDTTVLVF
jgi:hypothetical protein